jgi:hypothetical protein
MGCRASHIQWLPLWSKAIDGESGSPFCPLEIIQQWFSAQFTQLVAKGGRQRWDVGVGLDGVVESGRDAPAKPMCFLQLGTLPFPQVSTNIRSIWERMPLCPPCTAEKCVTSNTYN